MVFNAQINQIKNLMTAKDYDTIKNQIETLIPLSDSLVSANKEEIKMELEHLLRHLIYVQYIEQEAKVLQLLDRIKGFN